MVISWQGALQQTPLPAGPRRHNPVQFKLACLSLQHILASIGDGPCDPFTSFWNALMGMLVPGSKVTQVP